MKLTTAVWVLSSGRVTVRLGLRAVLGYPRVWLSDVTTAQFFGTQWACKVTWGSDDMLYSSSR